MPVAIRIPTITAFRPCGGWWIRLSHIFPCFSPLLRPFGPCGGWWIRLAIIISSAEMIIIGIDQCLHWSKRYTTGISHLKGFESHHPHTKQKHQPLRLVFCFGGGWWIRTTEGIASRFTVCPLWPLGNSPLFTCLLWSR